MSTRPSWEVLIGDMKVLNWLADEPPEELQPHPLQTRIEEIVENELTDHEREIFYLRFGEQLSYREMAERMGYDSHQTFHYQVEKIMEIVRLALDGRLADGIEHNQSNTKSTD